MTKIAENSWVYKPAACHFTASEILSKKKYTDRLEPLLKNPDRSEFYKVVRGYTIGMFQKRKVEFDHAMVDSVCAEVFHRMAFV